MVMKMMATSSRTFRAMAIPLLLQLLLMSSSAQVSPSSAAAGSTTAAPQRELTMAEKLRKEREEEEGTTSTTTRPASKSRLSATTAQNTTTSAPVGSEKLSEAEKLKKEREEEEAATTAMPTTTTVPLSMESPKEMLRRERDEENAEKKKSLLARGGSTTSTVAPHHQEEDVEKVEHNLAGNIPGLPNQYTQDDRDREANERFDLALEKMPTEERKKWEAARPALLPDEMERVADKWVPDTKPEEDQEEGEEQVAPKCAWTKGAGVNKRGERVYLPDKAFSFRNKRQIGKRAFAGRGGFGRGKMVGDNGLLIKRTQSYAAECPQGYLHDLDGNCVDQQVLEDKMHMAMKVAERLTKSHEKRKSRWSVKKLLKNTLKGRFDGKTDDVSESSDDDEGTAFSVVFNLFWGFLKICGYIVLFALVVLGMCGVWQLRAYLSKNRVFAQGLDPWGRMHPKKTDRDNNYNMSEYLYGCGAHGHGSGACNPLSFGRGREPREAILPTF